MRRSTGQSIKIGRGDEAFLAFIPDPLPPVPPLVLGAKDRATLERATRAIARLDAMTSLLPDTAHLLYAFVRKEALVSSQIEGTQSSLSDLLLYESDQAPGVPVEDVREVSDYVAALDLGVARVRRGARLSVRLLREVHRVLLRGGRGSGKTPGQLRRRQVWIGGSSPRDARFVPPPPSEVPSCMRAFEDYLSPGARDTSPLVRAALAHVQLETIHPFRDGNGRLGRLLVTLILCADGALAEPTLYLSLYFKGRRREYYDRLQRVRTDGDWEGWVRFFLEGVIATSHDAVRATRRILALFDTDRRRLERLGRVTSSALRVHEYMMKRPITTARAIEQGVGLTYPTVSSVLSRMKTLGIARELTGFKRNRVFAYGPYVKLLEEDADPLPPR